MPAVKIAWALLVAPATPMTTLEVLTIPSLAPKTAALRLLSLAVDVEVFFSFDVI
jgi:hypothetical protein